MSEDKEEITPLEVRLVKEAVTPDPSFNYDDFTATEEEMEELDTELHTNRQKYLRRNDK